MMYNFFSTQFRKTRAKSLVFSYICVKKLCSTLHFLKGSDQFLEGSDQFLEGSDQFLEGSDHFLQGIEFRCRK